jgi:hypothetical protein
MHVLFIKEFLRDTDAGVRFVYRGLSFTYAVVQRPDDWRLSDGLTPSGVAEEIEAVIEDIVDE